MMNLKTHMAYPESMPEADGTFTGRIYDAHGNELHIQRGFEDKTSFKKWVNSLSDQYQRGK